MIRFYDGPARAEILHLRRAPKFLRVVHSRVRGHDGLDQVGDAPRNDEAIFAYALAADPTWTHIKARGKGKRDIGGFWADARYQLVDPARRRDRHRAPARRADAPRGPRRTAGDRRRRERPRVAVAHPWRRRGVGLGPSGMTSTTPPWAAGDRS